MHYCTDTSEIKSEIEKLGHTVVNTFIIKQNQTNIPLSLFLVDLKPSENNKDLYQIEILNYTKVKFEPPRPKRSIPQGRLEFITNLMHNFIYSIIILHYDPQHVWSIAVLIFRRTIVYLQYRVSSHSVCCHTVCDDTKYCKYANCPPEDEHSDARNMLRITM
jgi:hypothetical protein